MSKLAVNIEPLNVENYATWSLKMRFLLIKLDLWKLVTGEKEDAELDEKALATIGLNVADHHLHNLSGKGMTSKQAWESLEKQYKAKSTARVMQLKTELQMLKKGAAEPLAIYVARAKTIWQDLKAAGNETSSADVVLNVLGGLPREYDIVRQVLVAGDKRLELEELLPKLLPVELSQAQHEEEESAFYAGSVVCRWGPMKLSWGSL